MDLYRAHHARENQAESGLCCRGRRFEGYGGLFWQPWGFYGVNPHELPGFFRDLYEILKKGKLLILFTL